MMCGRVVDNCLLYRFFCAGGVLLSRGLTHIEPLGD